jgi:hypothetical protein
LVLLSDTSRQVFIQKQFLLDCGELVDQLADLNDEALLVDFL